MSKNPSLPQPAERSESPQAASSTGGSPVDDQDTHQPKEITAGISRSPPSPRPSEMGDGSGAEEEDDEEEAAPIITKGRKRNSDERSEDIDNRAGPIDEPPTKRATRASTSAPTPARSASPAKPKAKDVTSKETAKGKAKEKKKDAPKKGKKGADAVEAGDDSAGQGAEADTDEPVNEKKKKDAPKGKKKADADKADETPAGEDAEVDTVKGKKNDAAKKGKKKADEGIAPTGEDEEVDAVEPAKEKKARKTKEKGKKGADADDADADPAGEGVEVDDEPVKEKKTRKTGKGKKKADAYEDSAGEDDEVDAVDQQAPKGRISAPKIIKRDTKAGKKIIKDFDMPSGKSGLNQVESHFTGAAELHLTAASKGMLAAQQAVLAEIGTLAQIQIEGNLIMLAVARGEALPPTPFTDRGYEPHPLTIALMKTKLSVIGAEVRNGAELHPSLRASTSTSASADIPPPAQTSSTPMTRADSAPIRPIANIPKSRVLAPTRSQSLPTEPKSPPPRASIPESAFTSNPRPIPNVGGFGQFDQSNPQMVAMFNAFVSQMDQSAQPTSAGPFYPPHGNNPPSMFQNHPQQSFSYPPQSHQTSRSDQFPHGLNLNRGSNSGTFSRPEMEDYPSPHGGSIRRGAGMDSPIESTFSGSRRDSGGYQYNPGRAGEAGPSSHQHRPAYRSPLDQNIVPLPEDSYRPPGGEGSH